MTHTHMHTYTHTHTHTHAHTHTHKHTYIYICTHTNTHTHTNTDIHTSTHTVTHTHTLTHTHTYTHTHTHTHTHIYAHSHTHTLTHTHTHTLMKSRQRNTITITAYCLNQRTFIYCTHSTCDDAILPIIFLRRERKVGVKFHLIDPLDYKYLWISYNISLFVLFTWFILLKGFIYDIHFNEIIFYLINSANVPLTYMKLSLNVPFSICLQSLIINRCVSISL